MNNELNEYTQETTFCCEFCLTNAMLDTLSTLTDLTEYTSVELVAKKDVITEVLRNLLANDDFDFSLGMITFDGTEFEYGKEYVLTINDNCEIWIEPLWRYIDGEWRLFDLESDVLFLHDESNSKILRKLVKDAEEKDEDDEITNIIIFSLGEEDE